MPQPMTGHVPPARRPANLHAWDYRAKAKDLGTPAAPIIDIHIHVNGPGASRIYRDVADLFGIDRLLTQTRPNEAAAVAEALGPRVSFMAVPDWAHPDKGHAFRQGFLDALPFWADTYRSRIVKFWAAPRLWEIVGGDPSDVCPLDSPWRVRAAELATQLGMMFMCHVADPDTWFATKYADPSKFPPKPAHYVALERMLDRFTSPWIAAHMGGWPEDLDFLSGLLERHPNLYLDTSATKWMVRELSRHPTPKARDFFIRWQDRILFGSDIVTLEDHLAPRADAPPTSTMSDLASSPEEAFDLYASRYWALRTMLETPHVGPSPIADPDLHMTDPARHDPLDAPILRGLSLPHDVLTKIYRTNALRVVHHWITSHGVR